jgi:hypothetical protein
MCTLNITLNYLFIPKGGTLSSIGIDGPLGAAIATLISLLVGLFGFQFAAKKMTKMKILNSHLPRHITAGVIMGLLLYYPSILFVKSVYWYHLIIFSGVGIVLYFGILFLLKEFKKQDFDFFCNMIHPKKMAVYIKSEINEKR